MNDSRKELENKLQDYLEHVPPGAMKSLFLRIAIRLFKYFYLFFRWFLPPPPHNKCDILVLGTCKENITRTENIWKVLRTKGYSVTTTHLGPQDKYLIALKYRLPVWLHAHYALFFDELYAQYLLFKYKPKVLCGFMSMGTLPSFMRYYAQKCTTIFIPHAIMVNRITRSSSDYDYMCVFGQSSIDNLRQLPYRIGTTKVLTLGSPHILETDRLPPSKAVKSCVFFSTWALEKDNIATEKARESFHIFCEWARKNQDFTVYIKLHPLETGTYVTTHTQDMPNITILEKGISLKDAIEPASFAITYVSMASLEAALMQRPTVMCNPDRPTPDIDDPYANDSILHLERFLSQRAKSVNELEDRISELLENYTYYVEQCKKYVEYHLTHTHNSQKHYVETIAALVTKNSLEDTTVLEECILK